MKKIYAFLMLSVMLVGLAACGSSALEREVEATQKELPLQYDGYTFKKLEIVGDNVVWEVGLDVNGLTLSDSDRAMMSAMLKPLIMQYMREDEQIHKVVLLVKEDKKGMIFNFDIGSQAQRVNVTITPEEMQSIQ